MTKIIKMEKFVIKNDKTGKFIGIDEPSGGYPYDTEIHVGAKIWNDKKSAREYRDMFKNEDWSLHEVKIEAEHVGWGKE